MKIDNQIVGAYNVIPYLYRYFGKEVLFGLSVDTMIDKEYSRRPFSLYEMATLVYEAMIRDGVTFVFGFPNDTAYKPVKRLLQWRDIGELDFYMLPLNIGSIMPRLSFVNHVSRTLAAAFVCLPRFRHKVESKYNVEKMLNESFESHRYDDQYVTSYIRGGGKTVHRICTEKQKVRVLYIIDVSPLTGSCFDAAIRELCSHYAKLADIILYVGKLPFAPRLLLRVPESKKPRNIHMCGRLLEHGVVDNRVFEINNWNVNISNFDVR